MKKLFCVLMLFIISFSDISAKGHKIPQYEINGAGSGTEGTMLVKVYVYGDKVNDQDLIRAAVHGVVFRGCAGNESGSYQPAMADLDSENDNASFYEIFFAEDGKCQNFATIIVGSYDRIKTKKGYKTGAILQVNKSSLRRELERAGVVRALSSGF